MKLAKTITWQGLNVLLMLSYLGEKMRPFLKFSMSEWMRSIFVGLGAREVDDDGALVVVGMSDVSH